MLKRLGNIAGDPLVTASKREESINTFKDMYGIFKVRAPKQINPSHHHQYTCKSRSGASLEGSKTPASLSR